MASILYATANTKLLWNMEGNSNDISGNANNGTDTAITYGTAYGKFGQGGLFNGTTSSIIKSTNLGIAGDSALTVAIWYQATAEIAAGAWGFYSIRSQLTVDRWFQPYYSYNAGTRQITCNAGGNVLAFNATLGTTWHSIIFTRVAGAGGLITCYLDGVLGSTVAQGASAGAGDYFYLGSLAGSNFNPGRFDEVIVENITWSAAQVASYYNGNSNFFMFM
jgi:hypothetical protein